jgi:hypothetical protein
MPESEVSDIKFEKEAKSASDKKMEAEGIPVYMETMDLTDDQKERIVKEIIAELKVIRDEREAEHVEKKWEALENQYNGEAEEDELQQFNLNRNVTKVKVDSIVTDCKVAFFESDPIFAVTPRPEFGKTVGLEVCSKQQDFLDYKVDNLPFEPEMDLVFHSAVVKGTGWLELFYDIQREPRKREESYETKMITDPVTNMSVNKGLIDFIKNWPNAVKDYPGYVKQMQEGKDISFVAAYKETVYNDPRPKFHDIKDVYVRLKVDGYQGLKSTRLIAVKESFSYWELKKEEENEKFYDIDKLVEGKDGKRPDNFESLDFDIFKCTYYFKENEEDTEEIKVIVWMHEDKKLVIGSVLYPYYAVGCCYIPFHIKRKKKGIYQPGVAEDLTDSHLAENAILNLTLGAAYLGNTITPITKDPDVHNQFLEKRFSLGVPLEAKAGEVDFLQKYMKPADIGGLLNLMQYLILGDDQVSRVSSLMTGQESPVDPTAPASKTLALMRQSGKGISDYIKHLLPSFNEIGYILLAIYYQMSKQGKKYTIRPENVVGDNPFGVLERNDMITRTNIQSRAYMFEFEKTQEKQLDLSLYQVIRQEPLVAKNPEAVYTLLKNLVDGWSKKWKNISNKVIPTLTDFKKMQLQAAMQGVAMYVNAVLQNSKITGVAPEFDVNQLLPIVADIQAQLVTPPAPEVVKEQQKQQKEAAGGA